MSKSGLRFFTQVKKQAMISLDTLFGLCELKFLFFMQRTMYLDYLLLSLNFSVKAVAFSRLSLEKKNLNRFLILSPNLCLEANILLGIDFTNNPILHYFFSMGNYLFIIHFCLIKIYIYTSTQKSYLSQI